MRPLLFALGSVVSLATFATFTGCSDESTAPAGESQSDAGRDANSSGRDGDVTDPPDDDAGGTDATKAEGPAQTEKEPNNGATTTEVDAMTIPGVMTGAIDPADDIDIFAITPAPGEFWEWTVAPKTQDLAPHLTIFDTAPDNTTNPNVLAKGSAADTITLQHFVLGTGKLVAAVRDARNVPTTSGRGGPTYGYTLTAKKLTAQPKAVTFPSTHTGKLASLSSVDLYSFTLAASTALDVIVLADRKTVPSTLDSRLSLFNATTKKSAGTNDDGSGTTDSQLGGTLPAGDYVVVVDAEGTDATDLSYELELKLR